MAVIVKESCGFKRHQTTGCSEKSAMDNSLELLSRCWPPDRVVQIHAGHSIAFKPEICFCTLWPCDLDFWPLTFWPNIKCRALWQVWWLIDCSFSLFGSIARTHRHTYADATAADRRMNASLARLSSAWVITVISRAAGIHTTYVKHGLTSVR